MIDLRDLPFWNRVSSPARRSASRPAPSARRPRGKGVGALAGALLGLGLLVGLPAAPSVGTTFHAAASKEKIAEPGRATRDGLRPISPGEEAARHLGRHAPPFVSESLGVAFHRPADSIVSGERRAGEIVYMIAENADSPDWNLSVQHLFVTAGRFDAEQQVEDHLQQLRRAERDFRVLENKSILVNGIQGHLAYVEQRPGREADPIVNGWLILPQGENVLLVFSMLLFPEDYARLRPMFDAIISTVAVRSAEELAVRRMGRIEAGRRFLERLDPDQLRELAGTREWSRIYREGADGDPDAEEEVGYALLEIREGRRGELNPDRHPDRYSDRERREGLLVRMQGRAIGDAQRNIFFDSLALYWISWDQTEEAWSVRGTQRQGEAARTESETGIRNPARTGAPRALLTVVRDRGSEYTREPIEWEVPESYLSQALGTIIGRLLPMDRERTVEYAYYFYNFTLSNPQLSVRIDEWGPADDDSGNWVLRTRLGAESPVITTLYSPSRQFIRRTRGDGTITEPISLERLHRLWQRKGLPTGPEHGSSRPADRTPGRPADPSPGRGGSRPAR